MLKFYKAYLHGEKEDARYYNEKYNLGMEEDSKAFDAFRYALNEIELDMSVDTETGRATILGVGGVKLERPVAP